MANSCSIRTLQSTTVAAESNPPIRLLMRLQETLCLIATAMGNPIRIPRPIHTQTDPPLSPWACYSVRHQSTDASQASSISRADNSPLSRITRTSRTKGVEKGEEEGEREGVSVA